MKQFSSEKDTCKDVAEYIKNGLNDGSLERHNMYICCVDPNWWEIIINWEWPAECRNWPFPEKIIELPDILGRYNRQCWKFDEKITDIDDIIEELEELFNINE